MLIRNPLVGPSIWVYLLWLALIGWMPQGENRSVHGLPSFKSLENSFPLHAQSHSELEIPSAWLCSAVIVPLMGFDGRMSVNVESRTTRRWMKLWRSVTILMTIIIRCSQGGNNFRDHWIPSLSSPWNSSCIRPAVALWSPPNFLSWSSLSSSVGQSCNACCS